MKKRTTLILLLTASFLCSCGTKTNSSNPDSQNESQSQTSEKNSGASEASLVNSQSTTTTSDAQEVTPTTSIQDMNILHAFNWSINNINSRLDQIKNAGYGAIQLSPLQVQKDYYGGGNWAEQWWKLYQPLSFSVASNDNQNALGKKSQLQTLCTNAEAKGLKIVMDVVSNHLANAGNGDNIYVLHNDVRHYESDIFNGPMTHSSSVHQGIDDNDAKLVVKGNMGMPDLQTETTHVQNRVISLLKEYINCGVDGFRFDAAKHIETPDDGEYASNFWPNVLGEATKYAKDKGINDLYYYGEILGTCGKNRSFSSYTKYMSVVDNEQGASVLTGIKNGNIANATKTEYNTGVNADHLVLWAESHDTYSNDEKETTDVPQEKINRAYMIQASRKDAATLYLARPNNDTSFGNVGSDAWKSSEVKAINLFHKRYVGKSESISNTDDKYFVNVNGSSSATINVPGLENGDYTDLISNRTYSVSNGKVNVTFTNGGCILIPKENGGSSNPDVTYSSDVVLTNYDTSKYYYAWLFDGTAADKMVKLTADHDALGFNMSGYKKFIIVEKTSDTSDWNNKVWQTEDLVFADLASDGKVILDCQTVPHKAE